MTACMRASSCSSATGSGLNRRPIRMRLARRPATAAIWKALRSMYRPRAMAPAAPRVAGMTRKMTTRSRVTG